MCYNNIGYCKNVLLTGFKEKFIMARIKKYLLIFCCLAFLAGCSSTTVVYDEDIDSYKYKPESDMEYLYWLAPIAQPKNPVE